MEHACASAPYQSAQTFSHPSLPVVQMFCLCHSMQFEFCAFVQHWHEQQVLVQELLLELTGFAGRREGGSKWFGKFRELAESLPV